MLSNDERALYRFVAQRYFRGLGQVIEVGTWLGSGTYEICLGLDNSGHHWALTVLDRFKWTTFYETHYPHANLRDGDLFLDTFYSNLHDFREKISAFAGDISEIDKILPLIQPVELLYIDAPKSWRMLWRLLKHVGPYLLPGGRLVMQDFLHVTSRQLIWLAMSIPAIEPRYVVADGTTVVFEVLRPISHIEQFAGLDFKLVDVNRLLSVWEVTRSIFPRERIPEIAVGLALDLLERESPKQAMMILNEEVAQTPQLTKVTLEVKRLLKKADAGAENLRRIYGFLEDAKSNI